MARTIDTTVTDNLPAIIRLMETGPKICQKYIEQPSLFQGKKFDLRYIVLVRSMNPLEIFLSDCFWVHKILFCLFHFYALKRFKCQWVCHILFQVRIANNQYSLDRSSLFEYETHFTVMVCLEYHAIQQQEVLIEILNIRVLSFSQQVLT